ncbi:MAG: NhaA family Na+:H+ antiporter [Myxococcota bacterium]|jgi:NhaA family Na+:H+ antiporter
MTAPLRRFLHIEAASGVLLLVATAIALLMANTGMAEGYRAFVDTPVVISGGPIVLDYPLWYWVNDALMALFFFVVGLEIKRELTVGELTDKRKAALPVIAAIGGAVLPALIFLVVLGDAEGMQAWAVPMATDIAFVVGALALFGSRVPSGLKVFVLTLAIADDLFAVLIIAFFFSEGIDPAWLGAAAGGFALVFAMRSVEVRSIAAYVLVGVFIWLCTLKSGVHPTVAGVLLGLMTPAKAWLNRREAAKAIAALTEALEAEESGLDAQSVAEARVAALEVDAPLERLENALHPWVAFLIMPLFVFVNAGVALGDATVTEGVGLAIALGLLFGKPIGIGLFAWLSVKFFGARVGAGVTWPMLFAAGVLCGVGFTMSLFIASLGLSGEALESAKAGILYGSGASLVLGLGLLAFLLPRKGALADEAADQGVISAETIR